MLNTYVNSSGLILSLLIGTLNIILGLIVYFRNPKAEINRSFFIVSIFLSLWGISSLISDSTGNYELSRITSQLAYGLSFLAFVAIWLFSIAFSGRNKKLGNSWIVLISIPLTILFSTTLVYDLTSINSYETGILYTPYVVLVASLLLFSIKNFVYATKNGKGKQKNQAQIILFGLGVLSFFALMTNAVLPVLININSDKITRIGPLFTLIFAGILAFAILKHKLFDIRLVVVRALGYVLAISLIAFLSFESLLAINYLIEQRNLSESLQAAILVIVSMLLAVSFGPFKRFFDRVTSRLFYRDAYETQELLNEFNKAIVSTIDTSRLLPRAGVVIEKYLKPEWVAFVLRNSDEDKVRIISEKKPINLHSIEKIRSYIKNDQTKMFVTDITEDNSQLKDSLQQADMGVISRVTTDVRIEGSGYILMGYKKSGNMYNSQDIGALEILSNELAIAIQNALQFEEIQKFNATLQDKVDSATRQLKQNNDKLKQMDETKDEFISMASHQLRTPLTSVKGYLSMVLEGDAGELNDMQKRMLSQAFTSSQRMVYLIADLLNVSRLRTGKFIIESTPISLIDLVEGEVSQLQETAQSRGLDLEFNKPDNITTLMLDETKIRQVVMNFIDNAIYYTPKGGKIIVKLTETESSVELTVEDNGMGVPKHEQHNLFSKFYRAGNARKARPDGTGLGLFMAKKVIVAQGGGIIFRSTEGKGSTFGFSFAKSKLAPPVIVERVVKNRSKNK